MQRYDCVVLYNTVDAREKDDCDERVYPSNIVRDEVPAIERSLVDGGFQPCVLPVANFSKDLVETLLDIAPKFVFNLCEAMNGSCELEMCVAGLLELMGIPYTGSPPLALGLALNKFHVKQILNSAGVPTPRGYVCRPGQTPAVPRSMRFPLIVKPEHEDASLGINSNSVCRTIEEIERQIGYIHEAYRQDALVEEYLDGREFNVSVLGDREPQVLAVQEIDFQGLPEGEPRIVSFRAKWDEGSLLFDSTVPVCPARLSKRLEQRIRDLALRSHLAVGCRDYSRVDMRTDARGSLYVLEVNPNPDISPDAGFARAACAAGYSYGEMIVRISEAAMERSAGAAVPVRAR
ncbi:MAG TPA: D-alanine--D-alanine ligase [Planctomycetes bacterium]|jgi:D-alanine-D-alanine ligase|nr:D-alanine--D-alanine ligase [Planctomycetota bacterium]